MQETTARAISSRVRQPVLPDTQRRALLGALLALMMMLTAPMMVAAREDPPRSQIHVTITGETAEGIAARYGVTLLSLARANNLMPGRVLQAGTRLVVPAPSDQTSSIHLVSRNETLQEIAALYDVTVEDLLLANNLASSVTLFIGQRLLIPVVEPPPAMFTPPPAGIPDLPASPPALPTCPGGCEALTIISPTLGITVTSPLLVAGFGSAGDGELVLRVLDATGFEIGQRRTAASNALGSAAPFIGTVTYEVPANSQPGRLQVYSVDPNDGAIEHLASVVVMLRGSELDAAIETLKRALEEKDYAAIETLLSDPWTLAFFRSEDLVLSSDQALIQLRQILLGPGDVTVDLTVDARNLLGDAVTFPPTISHVIYSTGWGPDAADDALLLFATDDTGQTRWTGMLYIYDGMRPYERT